MTKALKGCSSSFINSSSNRHRVSLAELFSSGFITHIHMNTGCAYFAALE